MHPRINFVLQRSFSFVVANLQLPRHIVSPPQDGQRQSHLNELRCGISVLRPLQISL